MHGETYLTTKNATSGTRGEPGHLDELDRDADVRVEAQRRRPRILPVGGPP